MHDIKRTTNFDFQVLIQFIWDVKVLNDELNR